MTADFTNGQNIEDTSPASTQGTELSCYFEYSHHLLSKGGKKKLREVASLGWHGFKLFAQSTEKFLNGTPFSIPAGVLNTLISISDVGVIVIIFQCKSHDFHRTSSKTERQH